MQELIDRVLLIGLAVVILVTAGMQPVGAGSDSYLQTAGTTDQPTVLVLPDRQNQTSNLDRPLPNVAHALTDRQQTLQSIHETETLWIRFQSIENNSRRFQLLQNASNDVAAEIESLERAQTETIESYQEGDESVGAFLREIAAIDARAHQLTMRVERIRSGAAIIGARSLQEERTNQLSDRLIGFSDPVRSSIRRSYRRANEAPVVYAAATPTGLVLSTVEESTYYRAAYDRSYTNDSSAISPIGVPEALSRWNEAYPNLTARNTRVRGSGTVGFHVFNTSRPNGVTITASIDSRTGEVFREVRRYPVSTVSSLSTTRISTDAYDLILHRPFGSGPFKIESRQPNAPVSVSLQLDTRYVGETGPDGTFWTVAPDGQVSVSATGPATVEEAIINVNDPLPLPTQNITDDS